MNLDASSTITFGDVHGLTRFFLDHYMVHLQTAQALTLKFGGSFSTVALNDYQAEDSWVKQMQDREPPTAALLNWLTLHNDIHLVTESFLAQGVSPPDLSIVDFSKESQFYDWMYAHQEVHDFEQQTLGLT